LAEDSAAFLLPINNRERDPTRSVQETQATRGAAHRAGGRCTVRDGQSVEN